MKLEGKTALVTGAARGIGRAFALRLAALGADVAVLDIDLHSYRRYPAEAAQLTADTTGGEVAALGRRSIDFEADVTDSAALEQAVAEIIARWGRLDIAVCNAGGGDGTLDETRASVIPENHLHMTVQRNLYGTINTCKAVAPAMKRQRSGRIVTVASIVARQPTPNGGYAHYVAAKAGVAMYTKALAQELGPYGINVNSIAPGGVLTARVKQNILESQGLDALAQNVALRRLATPQDCAGVLEFLVTDLSDYVAGAVIPVDGGARQ